MRNLRSVVPSGFAVRFHFAESEKYLIRRNTSLAVRDVRMYLAGYSVSRNPTVCDRLCHINSANLCTLGQNDDKSAAVSARNEILSISI